MHDLENCRSMPYERCLLQAVTGRRMGLVLYLFWRELAANSHVVSFKRVQCKSPFTGQL